MEEIKDLPPLLEEYKSPRRKLTLKDLLIIVMGGVIAVLIISVILLSVTVKKDAEYLSAQSSRVYEYYGERDVIVLDDPSYGDIWLSALESVPRHSMDYKNVKKEDGFKNYYKDGEKASITGIDVSYHQGRIDWNAVKADGVDFAMIRVGFRGYETGKTHIDERFHEYAEGALNAGLEIGVYFYSQAVTPEEAADEAQMVLNEIKDYRVMYPVVFDWEIVGEESARTNGVTSETLNECASVFCNTIARGGYIPMIYSVKRMALMKFDLSRLAGFDFWLAEYRDEPEFPYEFEIWQYASDGRVNGINGEVDLNMSLVDYSKVRR